MKKSITQEMPYGCGIACFAFVASKSYGAIANFLGPEQAQSERFYVKDFRNELNRYGLKYTSYHVNPTQQIKAVDGMIALLRRSRQFPVGHYLAYYDGRWMDPYINLQHDQAFQNPRSGFRDTLPGEIMYVLTPTQ